MADPGFGRLDRCPNCGYALAGLPTRVCPECAQAISDEDISGDKRRQYFLAPRTSALPFLWGLHVLLCVMLQLWIAVVVAAIAFVGGWMAFGGASVRSRAQRRSWLISSVWIQYGIVAGLALLARGEKGGGGGLFSSWLAEPGFGVALLFGGALTWWNWNSLAGWLHIHPQRMEEHRSMRLAACFAIIPLLGLVLLFLLYIGLNELLGAFLRAQRSAGG